MWYLFLNKERVLDFYSGHLKLSDKDISQNIRLTSDSATGDTYCMVWSDLPKTNDDLPVAIVIDEHNKNDFIAWASTYLMSYLPITCYTRILSADEFNSSLSLSKSTNNKLLNAWISGVIGQTLEEFYSKSLDLNPNRRLSLKTCINTKFFINAKSKILGYEDEAIQNISNRLDYISSQKTLKINDSQAPSSSNDFLNDALDILLQLDTNIVEEKRPIGGIPLVLFNLYKGKFDVSGIADFLDKEFEEIFSSLSKGTREDKFNNFEKIILKIKEGAVTDPLVTSFILGYSIHLVAPGKLEYWRAITSLSGLYGGSMLWYALCAGLYPNNTILDFQNGLGRKIKKELFIIESLSMPPRCDINYEEFYMSFSKSKQSNLWQSSNSGQLLIELAPFITHLSKWEQSQPAPDEIKPTKNVQDKKIKQAELDFSVSQKETFLKEISKELNAQLNQFKTTLIKEILSNSVEADVKKDSKNINRKKTKKVSNK